MKIIPEVNDQFYQRYVYLKQIRHKYFLCVRMANNYLENEFMKQYNR